jgi:hypothetical protein
MKFVLQLALIIILAHFLGLFLPWYYIAVAAFVGGYIFRSKANFLAGFLAIALLWSLKAAWIETGGSTDLVQRVANILLVKNKILLYVLTAVIGGLVGGFAALTGALLRPKLRTFKKANI